MVASDFNFKTAISVATGMVNNNIVKLGFPEGCFGCRGRRTVHKDTNPEAPSQCSPATSIYRYLISAEPVDEGHYSSRGVIRS